MNFYNLGFGEPHLHFAANSKIGFGDLLDEVIVDFPQDADTEQEG